MGFLKRKFGKKRYSFVESSQSKRAVKEDAKRARKKGKLARVVNLGRGDWALYTRSKKR